MAQSVIDWESSDSKILLNPRMSKDEQQIISDQLKEFDLPGHLWLTTSGTTSKFKCVALSKDAFLASAEAVNKLFKIEKNDIWLHCLPDFHVGGLGIYARSHLSGAKVEKLHTWDPSEFHSISHRLSATISAMVPTQLYDIIRLNYKAPKAYRLTIIGGAALTKELFDKSWKLGWNAVPTYGMTECASQIAAAVYGTYDHFLPLDHVKIRVGSSGKIMIKSPSLLTGYVYPGPSGPVWNNPVIDGWFETDDRGKLKENYLQVYGRGADIIKINGELVNIGHLQMKIDAILEKLNLDKTVTLLSFPHPRSGFSLHLAFEEDEQLISNIMERYNAAVMPYEKISKTHRVPYIPRTPLGKIDRYKLTKLIGDTL